MWADIAVSTYYLLVTSLFDAITGFVTYLSGLYVNIYPV